MKKIISIMIVLTIVICGVVPLHARTYPNPNLDLSNRPNDNTTIDEFIALIAHISYWAPGVNDNFSTDKTNSQASVWSAPYVQSEINKGVVNPSEIVFSDPATIAFAAKYLSNARGLYSWDFQNIYNVSGTENLSAEDKMYLNVAFDYGLIPYYDGINAGTVIKRKDVSSMLLDKPRKSLEKQTLSNDGQMKNLHVFFENNSNEMENELNLLKKNSNCITHVSFMGIKETNPDGSFNVIYDKPLQLEAIKYCKDNGIVTFLGVDNYDYSNSGYGVYDQSMVYEMISSKADQTIDHLMASLDKYDMDGINITFDMFGGSEYRDAYNQFMTKLKDRLKSKDKLLMTSVGAYFKDNEENESFYDYSALSDICDYIHIILYDENSANAFNTGKISSPGCNSDIVHIDRVLKYAYYKIQPEKILLGTQSFAIKFGSDSAENINYDPSWLSSPSFIYNEEEASGHVTSNSDTIYFETDEGLRQRLYYVCKFNMGGMSSFSLTSDSPIYEVMNESSAMRSEIISSMRKNIVPKQYYNYYSNGIKRDEFCDFIVEFIEAKSGKTINEFMNERNISATTGKFTDTSNTNVYAANALGIVNGRTDSIFGLEVITRQEAATMLKNLALIFNYQNDGKSIVFNDTNELAQWAKDGINYISSVQDKTNSRNVMSGTGNGNFSPYGTFTRAQTMMTMIRLYNAI